MVKVAILGFGTVGQGVAEVLSMNAEGIAARSGTEITVKYILDIRDFPESPFADRVIHDFDIIANDPEVEIVVETIGGQRFAYPYTVKALSAGKSVITSNKELVAERGEELLALARANGVNYLFEAAVGGGIPLIRPLMQCLSANEVTDITGILNGTTNYILTRMKTAGVSFADALKEAQANGYAEADPTADIEGHDACRKICILADLSYGHKISPAAVYTEGITGLSAQDMHFADQAGYAVKLLGRVQRRADGRVNILVAPHLVPGDRMIANVNDVFNGISVRGNAVDEVVFYGRGAGKLPTASAVVADVIDAAKNRGIDRSARWVDDAPDFANNANDMIYRHYVRLSGCTALQVTKQFPDAVLVSESAQCVEFTTAPEKTGEVLAKLDMLSAEGAHRQSLLRILDEMN
ncbi:MAG: homoserine dehydrogenase [Ruminococcaceae bacterium]|nr:homoserine dehydrogenase [Oscillospiraceae bacterium]